MCKVLLDGFGSECLLQARLRSQRTHCEVDTINRNDGRDELKPLELNISNQLYRYGNHSSLNAQVLLAAGRAATPSSCQFGTCMA